ncbi:sensor histidine kinase [uncultured Paracoccus sp.]|uniref:sensor histidine kinase n=1 Tax=uncultured Paracoccus sp. TaxID=189685 RepID=UPI002612B938|nr:sensor histidine kinase [uncultured Paracoccus sp.]
MNLAVPGRPFCRPSLRDRLRFGAAGLALLAVLAAGMAVYGLARTRSLAADAMAAQRRADGYAAHSAQVNDWMLGWLMSDVARAGYKRDPAPVLQTLQDLDGLVAEDLALAPDARERARRAAQLGTLARLRGLFLQLQAAMEKGPPGSRTTEAAIAFYGAQAPVLAAGQAEQEMRRRDAALDRMDDLSRPMSWAAVGIGILAPLVLIGLYMAVLRPLFVRLDHATRGAEGLALGQLPPEARGHDELGLMFARMRQMARRLDRRRRHLAQDYARLETIVEERTRALSAANARLARVDATRRRLFADVGHELRTPLTVIMGEAELAAGHPDPQVRAAFDTVRNRAERLFRRIEDLLRIARSESGQLELTRGPVELAATVALARSDLAPVMKRAGVTVTSDLPPLVLAGDGDWLRQVFSGFLENAAKYAGRGAAVRISARAEGSRAVIEIADDGPGLVAAEKARIFERFGRTSGASDGFGVGLALAHWIVTSLGGELVALESGKGLRLRMSLPLWEEG